MTIAKLAGRNLLRSPRRTILTMVAIVAGIGFYVLGEGFIAGIEENVRVSSIEGLNGHVLARPEGYPDEGLLHPVDELLSLDPETRRFLDAETVAWTQRILFSPTAATGEDHMRVRAIGYDPKRDPEVFSRRLWELVGREPDPDQDEILVTPGIADLLELSAGDQLVLQARTHRGAMNAIQVRVTGVAATRLAHIDTMGVLMPISLAQRIIAADAPTHVSVRLASRDATESFKERLAGVMGEEAEIVTWQEDTRALIAMQTIRRRALEIISFILLALAGFGMANTILMAAHERVREIGTLRSMGMTTGGVTGLFLVEGLLMGTVGSLLGVLWGGILAYYWQVNPIDMRELVEEVGGGNMAFSAFIYTQFSVSTLLLGVAFGIAVSILASIYPARTASRMPPAEAVRAQ